jgi:N-acetylglucosaminyldiphosphoundecaprenol N-acetyl-beta-D-mannosaminyltransferase
MYDALGEHHAATGSDGVALERVAARDLLPASARAQRRVEVRANVQRDVICLFGLPFDRVTLEAAAIETRAAIKDHRRLHIATPNINLLRIARQDAGFRDALLAADLSIIDGMPFVWLARFMGLGKLQRVAGSDLFDVLAQDREHQTRTCFFGGEPETAARLKDRFCETQAGISCTAAIAPGFGSLESMGEQTVLDTLNRRGADLLLLAIGAQKGLHWIARHERELDAPVIANLGATINFAAGTVARAPEKWRSLGLEWLWRIREEPVLFKRYAKDLALLSSLAITQAIPIATLNGTAKLRDRLTAWLGKTQVASKLEIRVEPARFGGPTKLRLSGELTEKTVSRLKTALTGILSGSQSIELDLRRIKTIDAAGLGLILIIRGQLLRKKRALSISVGYWLRFVIRLHGCGYILPPSAGARRRMLAEMTRKARAPSEALPRTQRR